MRSTVAFRLTVAVALCGASIAGQALAQTGGFPIVRSDAEALVAVDLAGQRRAPDPDSLMTETFIYFASDRPMEGRGNVGGEMWTSVAQCDANRFRWQRVVRFASGGGVAGDDELFPLDRWVHPEAGSLEATVFAAQCGRPVATFGTFSPSRWSEMVKDYREAVATGAVPYRAAD